jgi:hypothetical protein
MESGGARVSTIVGARSYPKGTVRLVFDGRTAAGALLPDGTYMPVVRLLGNHRTIALPNEILLDTHAPRVTHVPRLRTLIAPGSSGHPQHVLVPYTLSAPGHGVLFADGHRVAFTLRQRLHGVLEWTGTIDRQPVPAGHYTLEIAVQDAAGNRSKPFAFARITVRYLELARKNISVRRRQRFSVGVLIGPARVSWLLAGTRGSSGSRTLHLRAPARRGSYRLFVSGAGHATSALVRVR